MIFRLYIPTLANGKLIDEKVRTRVLDTAIAGMVQGYSTVRTWNFVVHTPRRDDKDEILYDAVPATVIEANGSESGPMTTLASAAAVSLGCRILMESCDKPKRVWA